MAGCENITNLLPTSEEYYAVIDRAKLSFLSADVVLTVLILLLFAEECHFVVKTYKHFNISVKSLWLVSIYPVFALTSLLAVVVPRAEPICGFVATCYLSACLFQFSSLLLLYFGHVDHLLEKVKETGFSFRSRPCCCCCRCCPVLPPVRKSLRIVRLMIFQTAILQPILQFISAVLWADGKYSSGGGIDFTKSYSYLNIFKLISTITALYGLSVLHTCTEPHLVTHNTKPKYVALQLVQLFYNVQGTIFTIPAQYDKPPCRDGLSSQFQMLEWHHLVLVVEMFLLAVLARAYYRRPLTLDVVLEAQLGTLADIYTPGKAYITTDGNTTVLGALSETEKAPENEGSGVDDSQPVQAATDQVCALSEGKGSGILNPNFEAENEKLDPGPAAAALGNERDAGKTPSNEKSPSSDDKQCTDLAETQTSGDSSETKESKWSIDTNL